MATKKIDTSHIAKLNGDNYSQWKLQVSLVLKALGVWGQVDGSVSKPRATSDNAAAITAWEEKDITAQAIIVPLLDKRQMSHVYDCESSQALWDKLKKINSDSSVLNKQHTLSNPKRKEGAIMVTNLKIIGIMARITITRDKMRVKGNARPIWSSRLRLGTKASSGLAIAAPPRMSQAEGIGWWITWSTRLPYQFVSQTITR
jgi:hypothetical protein